MRNRQNAIIQNASQIGPHTGIVRYLRAECLRGFAPLKDLPHKYPVVKIGTNLMVLFMPLLYQKKGV